MSLPDHLQTFQLLIAGILNSDHNRWKPPDSPIFLQAINRIACLFALKEKRPPSSLSGWLKLFEIPIAEWWPSDLAELDIQDGDTLALLYEGRPEDWQLEYFEIRGIDPDKIQKGLISFKSEMDQQDIALVQSWCGETAHPEIYSTYREFLIRNPKATLWDLNDFMIQFNVNIPVKIQSFYEEPGPDRLFEGYLWECPYCHGILKWQRGEPYCTRHNVCGRITDHYAKRKPIEYQPSLRVLKFGAHQRTCTPGIPEVGLYDQCAGGKIPGIAEVILWPGYDTYDLRILFADGKAWAVDVKDLGQPSDLRRTIDKGLGKIYATKDSAELGWEKAFYIVPDFRLEWKPGYIEISRSDKLTKGETDVVALKKFIGMVKKRGAKAINVRNSNV